MKNKELEKMLDEFVESMADKDINFKIMDRENKLITILHKLTSKFITNDDTSVDKDKYVDLLDKMIKMLEEAEIDATTNK